MTRKVVLVVVLVVILIVAFLVVAALVTPLPKTSSQTNPFAAAPQVHLSYTNLNTALSKLGVKNPDNYNILVQDSPITSNLGLMIFYLDPQKKIMAGCADPVKTDEKTQLTILIDSSLLKSSNGTKFFDITLRRCLVYSILGKDAATANVDSKISEISNINLFVSN